MIISHVLVQHVTDRVGKELIVMKIAAFVVVVTLSLGASLALAAESPVGKWKPVD